MKEIIWKLFGTRTHACSSKINHFPLDISPRGIYFALPIFFLECAFGRNKVEQTVGCNLTDRQTGKKKNVVMGSETKKDCVGKGQQQFTGLDWKVDSWNNVLAARQSPACKNVSTEAEDIIGTRRQATSGEDIAKRQDFMCAVVTVIFGACNSVRLL
jgi:hypothetical protein